MTEHVTSIGDSSANANAAVPPQSYLTEKQMETILTACNTFGVTDRTIQEKIVREVGGRISQEIAFYMAVTEVILAHLNINDREIQEAKAVAGELDRQKEKEKT